MNEVYSLPGRNQHPVTDAHPVGSGPGEPAVLRSVGAGGLVRGRDRDLSSKLSPDHRRILFEESSISPDVAARAGVFTARSGSDVPQNGGYLPKKPGMVFPTRTLDGECFHRLRLDKPGRGSKYLQPKGLSNRLYIHLDQHDRIRKPGGLRLIFEGEKKTLSAVSRGLLAVGVSGVWNGQKDKKLIPDWNLLPLDGESYAVCFDSDIRENKGVADAAQRQAELLSARGAKVYITLLPHALDGTKQGADDFFANGGTVEELYALTYEYTPEIFEWLRRLREGELHDVIQSIRADWWETDWNRITGTGEKPHWMRGYSARDVEEALIRFAEKRGKLTKRGVRLQAGSRTISNEAGKGRPATLKALKHLEAEGKIEIHEPKNPKEARSYTLLKVENRGSVTDVVTGTGGGAQPVTTKSSGGIEVEGFSVLLSEKKGETLDQIQDGLSGRGNRLRSPSAARLRWSSPARKGTLYTRREKYGDSVRVVTEVASVERPFIRRLGARRGAIIDLMERVGKPLSLRNICEALKFGRERDVRRRALPMLEEYGIISVENDVITLVENWRVKLDECRRETGEIEAATLQKARHREESRQFRERGKTPKASLEGARLGNELRERRLRERREEEKRDRAAELRPPSKVEAFIRRVMSQHTRLRMGLLCDVAREEGLRSRDIPPVVRSLGYRVERLSEYGDQEFIYAERAAA